MYDSLRVNINHCLDDLADVNSGLKLSQSFPSFGQIFESVVPAVLKKNIYILLIFEGIYELDNVLVLQTAMNFDFDE